MLAIRFKAVVTQVFISTSTFCLW